MSHDLLHLLQRALHNRYILQRTMFTGLCIVIHGMLHTILKYPR